MGRRLLAILASVIAIVLGLTTLLGLLVGDGQGTLSLLVERANIRVITNLLLQVVAITAAVTIIIGILNLFGVHLGRVRRRSGGWFYSLVLVLSCLAVIVLTLLERGGVLTLEPAITSILLNNVQVSIESALAGLLLFTLVYGAYRLLRGRINGWGLLFTLTLLLILVGALPLPGASIFADVRNWLMQVPVSAGARGILLGIALAAVVAGVRVLTGQDRSYRE